MKQLIYIFLMLFLVLSCTSNTIYKKPKNLIAKEQMINLWVDIYIAKGATHVKTKDLRKNINYVPLILRKHQIDSAQFSESNIYYTSNIDAYEKMFQEVKKRLETIQDQYKPKTKDSVQGSSYKDSIKKYEQEHFEDIIK